jgi:hypothetical protein
MVSAVGEYIPQRVLSEPVAIPWVAIRKTVNATAYRHDVKIHLAMLEGRLALDRLSLIVGRKGCYR